ncbi:alpha/beta hydrolase [Paucibacter sediminis]|uniref:Alpha/beta hydrolase n=1 Tax=Paucibacter sediminis TaxID=3019553 RepID=A0AA95NG72_9BURK|nr:alpha/beta hydrolase [Paucibacter sp. S2-9]WIT13704.1 alpha/beta hydrolase [Paucibacter sp. S2-9]
MRNETEISTTPTQLRCSDGRLLQATWHEPAGPLRAVAVVSPAMAVASPYYRGFAEWLARRGYAVLSYDYRGIGTNLQGRVRDEAAGLRDWAGLDMAAALRAADKRRQQAQQSQGQALGLLAIGHSFGGNAVGMAPGFECADALLGVAAQAADWRFWSGLQRAKAMLFFHALLPGLSHLLGHGPAWLLGARAQALPKAAALDWARWGRRRGYMFSDPSLQGQLGHHRYTGPVHLWNVSDDSLFGPAPRGGPSGAPVPQRRGATPHPGPAQPGPARDRPLRHVQARAGRTHLAAAAGTDRAGHASAARAAVLSLSQSLPVKMRPSQPRYQSSRRWKRLLGGAAASTATATP